jgi:hypothetical protein
MKGEEKVSGMEIPKSQENILVVVSVDVGGQLISEMHLDGDPQPAPRKPMQGHSSQPEKQKETKKATDSGLEGGWPNAKQSLQLSFLFGRPAGPFDCQS